MDYIKFTFNEGFNIRSLYSIHYFEFAKDFVFSGEKHDFWEFLYVDKGEVEVMADINGFNLKQGDIIFHKPNEFHNVWANKIIAPNLVVISFECTSSYMSFFENKIFSLSNTERNIMASIIKEGMQAFQPPFNLPLQNTLYENKEAPPCSQQLVKINLEMLLISIFRKGNTIIHHTRLSSTARERSENEITSRLSHFMQENIHKNLTIQDLCHFSKMGKTLLMTMFRERTGETVMVFFRNLKIEQAKKLMREGTNNFTEISDILGFSSIHCFTRTFKKAAGMTPTEYAKSVMARA